MPAIAALCTASHGKNCLPVHRLLLCPVHIFIIFIFISDKCGAFMSASSKPPPLVKISRESFFTGEEYLGHPLFGCPYIPAAASSSTRASQPMADNYALATDRQTNKQKDSRVFFVAFCPMFCIHIWHMLLHTINALHCKC